MPIPFSKYVRITSGVGGGSKVSRRDLIGRILSSNQAIGPNEIIEVTSNSDKQLEIFIPTSSEKKFANDYFSYVSPTQGSTKKLSFGRYVKDETVSGSSIYTTQEIDFDAVKALLDKAVLTFRYGSDTGANVSRTIDFRAADTLEKLIVILNSAFKSGTTADVLNGATAEKFNFKFLQIKLAANNGDKFFAVSDTTSKVLKLDDSSGAKNVAGTVTKDATPLVALERTIKTNPNFGSFGFIDTLTLDYEKAIAAFNSASENPYMACFPTFEVSAKTGTVEADADALKDFQGTALTYSTDLTHFFPMIIMAATEYDRPNSVQNYMYRQHGSYSPSVTDGAKSDAYDKIKVNYYGSTSSAGQEISFYQRGVLMGQNITDMNVFANEMWLKDYAGSQIMNLQLGLGQISANATGASQITNILQQVVVDAVSNGVISVDKDLTQLQKDFITQQTKDPLAWLSVQKNGYVLKVTIGSDKAEYYASYLLVYSKGDAVRKVIGTHSLI